jgi:DNA-binding NarL/FixJ family response regulator/signal transduction histidine kinase
MTMDAASSMQPVPQWIAVFFLGSAILAAVVAARAARFRREATWRYLAYTMAAVSLWSFSDAMFFTMTSSEAALWFWLVAGYVGSIACAPLIFLVALCFASQERRLTRLVRILLWAPFVLGMLLAITNHWHGLIWNPDISPLGFKGGPGHGAYFFLLLPLAYGLPLLAAFIFLHSCWRLRHIYRRQAIVLSVAVLLPVAASLLYFTDLNPLPGVDMAPAAFAVTGVLGLYSMARLRFMELRPIYRDALFEQMSDGALAIDGDGRLLDLNPAAQRFLGITPELIGHPALPYLAARLAIDDLKLSDGAHQMLVTRDPPLRYFDLRVTDAGANGDQARLVVWRDTTRLHAAVVAVYEQGIVLAERARAEAAFAADMQRAITNLQAQMQQAMESLDHGQIGVAAATLAQARTVTANRLLAEVDEVQAAASPSADFLAALERYVLGFAQDAGLHADIVVDAGVRADDLAPGVRLHTVHILQEALENIRKHAAAQRIETRFTRTADGIVLSVHDDGVGFDMDDRTIMDAGAGLEAMHRRAQAFQGDVTIDSTPGAGTRLRVRLPVNAPHVAALKNIRVTLAHSHPLVLDGLRALLAEHGMRIDSVSHDYAALASALTKQQPGLILIDINLPSVDLAEAVRQTKRSHPASHLVLLLESEQDPRLAAMLRNGADGYLFNTLDTPHFLAALAQIVDGGLPLQAELATQLLREFRRHDDADTCPPWMTARQVEILRLVGAGMTYPEIGARLYLSERTVRYHTDQMRRRLQLANRSELAQYARQRHLDRRD